MGIIRGVRPDQHLVKIVHDEQVKLMGGREVSKLHFLVLRAGFTGLQAFQLLSLLDGLASSSFLQNTIFMPLWSVPCHVLLLRKTILLFLRFLSGACHDLPLMAAAVVSLALGMKKQRVSKKVGMMEEALHFQ